jgi:hypothetical protein
MFTRVVVGWDGAPHSAAALEWAAARYADLPIEVVHAIGGSDRSDEYLSPTGELSTDRVRLIDAVERLREQHPGLCRAWATMRRWSSSPVTAPGR